METSVHSDELTKAKKGLRGREVLLFILAITNLLTISVAYENKNRERTILLPPVVREAFWVDSNDASEGYLQEMSTYLIFLANNVSPSNVDYQKKLFIDKVNPSQQGTLKIELDKQSQRVKRNNLVTMFYIKGFKIDAASNKVVVTGQLDSLIGDKMISSREKVYRLGYQLINGKLYVNEYGVVNSNNPWGDFISEN